MSKITFYLDDATQTLAEQATRHRPFKKPAKWMIEPTIRLQLERGAGGHLKDHP